MVKFKESSRGNKRQKHTQDQATLFSYQECIRIDEGSGMNLFLTLEQKLLLFICFLLYALSLWALVLTRKRSKSCLSLMRIKG